MKIYARELKSGDLIAHDPFSTIGYTNSCSNSKLNFYFVIENTHDFSPITRRKYKIKCLAMLDGVPCVREFICDRGEIFIEGYIVPLRWQEMDLDLDDPISEYFC